jgi:coenzyme F420-reducing hydrogenase delta subunit
MCTGRIDPAITARAFEKGLDGLLVVGCYFGDCHYISGNYQAKAKLDMAKRLLAYVGMNPDRLSFRQCSSGEASVFVGIVTEFTKRIKELGPLGGGADRLDATLLKRKLKIAEAVLAGEKMRWVIGKRAPFLQSGNMYGEIFTEQEFNRAIDMIIVEETEVQEILAGLREGARSVKDLAVSLSIPAERVFRHILALKRKGFVAVDRIVERSPLYSLLPKEV